MKTRECWSKIKILKCLLCDKKHNAVTLFKHKKEKHSKCKNCDRWFLHIQYL